MPTPQTNGRFYLPSLRQPVTIHRDRWGVPHIYAANTHDLLLAQGFVHAQDRLWQMELNRRAANGELSAMLGPLTLATDRLARTLGWRQLAQATWDRLDDDARADVTAYVAGVNAYSSGKPVLPLEFKLLRWQPQPWTVLDTLAYARLQMWALNQGATAELINASLLDALGAAKTADLTLFYPSQNPHTLAAGIEINALRLDGLTGAHGSWTHPLLGKGADGSGRGSNGWVIAPERSSTGHAILANDMHLPVGAPSLWHFQHLHSQDGLQVAGFTQPGVPYVLAGHNGRIAWGITVSFVDTEDFFIEQLSEDGQQYRFRGAWHPLARREETITVRGRAAITDTVRQTHHGPLVGHLLGDASQPLSLRATALDPDATIEGFRLLNLAQNWDNFIHAVSHIHAPSLNILYADTADNIGYAVSGRAPIRAAGSGVVPAPGWDGEHEWTGYIPPAEMPHALNPASGFLVNANNCICDEAYPHALGHMWRNGYRAKRITQLIMQQTAVSPADCQRFHVDRLCLPALELIAALADVQPTTAAAAQALTLLRQWDGWLGAASGPGALYKVWEKSMTEALLRPFLTPALQQAILGQGPNPFLQPANEFLGNWSARLPQVVADPAHWLWHGRSRTALINDCLAQALHICQKQLGKESAHWRWGKIHRVTFSHALGLVPGLRRLFNRGPYAIGGDVNTVAQTGILPGESYDNNALSVSSRHIVDLGDIENSRAVLAPGQSGWPGSPHYDDLAPLWRSGRYFPISWAVEAVTAVTAETLTLQPRLC